MLSKTKIITYSHGMIVKPHDRQCREALSNYCQTLVQWEYVKKPPRWKPVRTMKRVFAGATKDRSEYRFHRTCYDEVVRHLKGCGIRSSSMEFIELDVPEGKSVDMPWTAHDVTPRDYQVGLIDYLANPDQSIKVTDLQTGKGKTMCALTAMRRIGKRTVIQLRGGYVSRWMDDLKGLFSFKKGELLVIRGRDSLQSIINMAKADDLNVKVILITNKTLYNFFAEHERNEHYNIYDCKPEDLYSLLDAGLRIVDEVHEDYHLNFRTDIYSNIKSSIHLSATLDTEDAFRRRMYDIALPQDCWYRGIEYDKYIQSYALFYNTVDIKNIRTSERGHDTYSHGAYEKSILRDKKMLDNYLEIIRYPIQEFYIEDDWQSGQKCIVFCYLVEFCEILRDHLRGYYPELEILEYVSATDAEVLKRADIIISTIKSAGTAQDIPNLKVSVMSTAVRKKEANIQTLGRLRKLKRWPDVTPTFCYLNNTSIETHLKYHEAKKEIFMPLVMSQKVGHIPIKL